MSNGASYVGTFPDGERYLFLHHGREGCGNVSIWAYGVVSKTMPYDEALRLVQEHTAKLKAKGY